MIGNVPQFLYGWTGAAGPGLFRLALNPESLSLILAGLLALIFDWFPGLAPRFDRLNPLTKRLVMTGLLAVVTAAIFAAGCTGWLETGVACAWTNLPLLVQYILAAAGVNQAVHLLAKPAPGGRG